MKDTLHTIQTFARLGRVLSRIAYILALIECIACAVSLLLLPLGSDALLRLGGITLYGPVSGSVLLTQILQGVAAQLWAVELDFVPGAESSVLLGLLFLALSLLCRYGAELTENAV